TAPFAFRGRFLEATLRAEPQLARPVWPAFVPQHLIGEGLRLRQEPAEEAILPRGKFPPHGLVPPGSRFVEVSLRHARVLNALALLLVARSPVLGLVRFRAVEPRSASTAATRGGDAAYRAWTRPLRLVLVLVLLVLFLVAVLA